MQIINSRKLFQPCLYYQRGVGDCTWYVQLPSPWSPLRKKHIRPHLPTRKENPPPLPHTKRKKNKKKIVLLPTHDDPLPAAPPGWHALKQRHASGLIRSPSCVIRGGAQGARLRVDPVERQLREESSPDRSPSYHHLPIHALFPSWGECCSGRPDEHRWINPAATTLRAQSELWGICTRRCDTNGWGHVSTLGRRPPWMATSTTSLSRYHHTHLLADCYLHLPNPINIVTDWCRLQHVPPKATDN